MRPQLKKKVQSELYPCSIIQLILLASSTAATEVVSVHPPVLVSGLGYDAIFICTSSFAVIEDIEWLINGTSLSNLQLTGVNQFLVINLQLSRVRVEYNNTMVQCIANTTTHGVVTSGTSTLLVQDFLFSVENLVITNNIEDCTVYLYWMAPFTLNITFVEPDITYCVDAVNSTSSATLHSECGINVTEFTYPLPPRSWCDVYNFTVTPVNIVGNGTRKSMNYSYVPKVMSIARLPPLSLLFTSHTTYFVLMSAPVCLAELTFVDINTGEITTLEGTELTIKNANITFTTQHVKKNRHYSVSVTASNVAAVVESAIMASTHDIKNASIAEHKTGVTIKTDYFDHSSASGALYIFVPLDDSGAADLTGAVYLALDRNTSHNNTLPFSLSGGRMEVFVYDVESDGTLASGVGYPTVNMEIPRLLFLPVYSLLRNCNVTASDLLITVQCHSNDSMLTSMLTGFQMIVQMSNVSKAQRLYINQAVNFQDLNFQARTSVLVEENGLYQVAIFAIRRGRGILYSSAQSIEQVMVNGSVSPPSLTTTMTTTATTTNVAATTVGLSAVLSGVLIVMIIILCFKTIIKRCKPKEENVELEQLGDAGGLPGQDIPQLYEEIGDAHAESSAETAQPSRLAPQVPEYEDVGLTATRSTDPYQITKCSAYGVSLT